MRPGKKFLAFVPEKLLAFNKEKGTTKLYNEFKKDVVEKGGGNHRTGWKSKGIYDVVNEWQPRFNEKGVGVQYSMVNWYVPDYLCEHTEYRYWLEFLDVETVGGAYVSAYINDPASDKKLKEEIGTGVPVAAEVSAGAPLAESVIDVSGEWSIDEKRNTSRFIKSGSMKITRNGAVFSVHGMTAWSWSCFWGKKDWSAVLIAVKDAPNTYDVRVEANTTRVTVLSEDEIKAEGDKLKEPLYYIR